MRPLLLSLSAFGALSVLSSCSCSDDLPTGETGAGAEDEPNTNDLGHWLSMDVTPEGQPAIAYYDATRGGLGFGVGTIGDGGVAWEHFEVDGYPGDDGLDPGDVGQYASMAIADDGTIWIAYHNASVGGLYYARCSDGVWETGLADAGGGSSADGAGTWASVALDDSGDPTIAHYYGSRAELRVATWDGAAFSTQTVDEGEAHEAMDSADEYVEEDVGAYAHVMISGGTTYVAYFDAANGDLKLATSSGGAYSVEVVDTDGGTWPSMLDAGGQLYIAYNDVGNQDLKVAWSSGGDWTSDTIDDGTYVGADAEIYASGDDIGVIYQDAHENDMRRVLFTGGGWSQPEVVIGAEGAMGFFNETVEIGGTRYVACYDYTNRGIWFSAL